jgi:hypothetical protein
MVSLGGSFFTKDGIVPDEALLKKQIYGTLGTCTFQFTIIFRRE